MFLGAFIVFAILAFAYYIRERKVPHDVRIPERFREISPEHYDKALDAAERFETEYSRRDKAYISAMTGEYLNFEKHSRELVFRLPQDPQAEADLEACILASLAAMRVRTDAIRRLQDHPLQYPQQLDH